jgi:adenine-specific DNA-methyltransferase
MKYIGNKTRLLGFIESSLISAKVPLVGTFCDIFAGTANVGFHFKKTGMKILSNDIMTYSYHLQKAMLELNDIPKFNRLKKHLNLDSSTNLPELLSTVSNIEPKKGYFFENFSPSGISKRQFFTDENGQIIDGIRDALQEWLELEIVDEREFCYLLASLINAADHVANMSGTYGAFLKIWRSVALKKLSLQPIQIFDNKQINQVTQGNSLEIIKSVSGDILYLDPPYNSRQYASNFHVMESLAVWDKQDLRGVVGLRDYESQKSAFSSKREATSAFKDLITNSDFKYIALSYNNEGIINRKDIIEILDSRGELLEFVTDYRRFRTERDHEKRQYKQVDDKVSEHLWIVKTK